MGIVGPCFYLLGCGYRTWNVFVQGEVALIHSIQAAVQNVKNVSSQLYGCV